MVYINVVVLNMIYILVVNRFLIRDHLEFGVTRNKNRGSQCARLHSDLCSSNQRGQRPSICFNLQVDFCGLGLLCLAKLACCSGSAHKCKQLQRVNICRNAVRHCRRCYKKQYAGVTKMELSSILDTFSV